MRYFEACDRGLKIRKRLVVHHRGHGAANQQCVSLVLSDLSNDQNRRRGGREGEGRKEDKFNLYKDLGAFKVPPTMDYLFQHCAKSAH